MSAYEEQELKKLERALASLTPRPALVNRDELLFEAGRRSVGPPWLWRGAAAGMTLLAGFFAFVLLIRTEAPPERVTHFVEMPVHSPVAVKPAPAAPRVAEPPAVDDLTFDAEPMLPPGSYWRMQQAALRDGVERMPSADFDGGPPSSRPVEPMLSVGSTGVVTRNLIEK